MTARAAAGPLRRHQRGARAAGAAPTYTTTRDTTLKYAYEDLSDDQFEKLVVLMCQRLFGIATQPFAKGPDGGRDAKFIGTAERHPSTSAPWSGTTIIQAKHTNGYNRSFSETDFYSPKAADTVIGKEIPRIKKLKANGELDHYVLVANRRMTGKAQSDISKAIADECGIPIGSIYLCGVEQLELLLVQFPDIPAKASLDMVDAPLVVNSFDIAEVVEAFAASKGAIGTALETLGCPGFCGHVVKLSASSPRTP